MWNVPRLGIEPVSPVLAYGFLSTAPPGKSRSICFYGELININCSLLSVGIGNWSEYIKGIFKNKDSIN